MTNLDTTAAGGAVGLSDPTLVMNLSPVNDFGTQAAFIDIMKNARLFNAPKEGGGFYKNKELRDAGVFDENGYPTFFPEDAASFKTLWDWGHGGHQSAEARSGTYILEYEGEGEINLGWYAKIVSKEPGRIVFDNEAGAKFFMEIKETDPNGTGDYIRNISIIKEEHVELHEAGAIFNPDWLEVIEDVQTIRFMEWMRTNHSVNGEWDDRPTVDDASYGTYKGVPVEVMVELANQTGTDPWFNMPHFATEEYIREFAIYVRDNLDPDLRASVELSNEVWNPAFSQGHRLAAAQKEEWGVHRAIDSYSKAATEMALIWDEVFADEPDGRIQKVLGTQTNNPWITSRSLSNPTWEELEPETYVRPGDVFDAVAVTTYFGGRYATDPTLRARLEEAIADPETDAFEWLRDDLLYNAETRGSIPYIAERWAQHKNILDQNGGIDLIAYEGGQHVHHLFATNGSGIELSSFFADFVRSEEMAEVYEASWNAWTEVSDGGYNQFGDVSPSSKWGSWGLYNYLGDETPRSEFLEQANAETGSWWDDRGGEHFQQGVIEYGDETGPTDDVLVGTSQEDFLIGGEGDDDLIGGAEDDGLHGGEGEDTAHFSGSVTQYTLAETEDGYVISGPDGEDLLVSVEKLSFDDGVYTVEQVLAGVQIFFAPASGGVSVEEEAEPGHASGREVVEITEFGMKIGGVAKQTELGRELAEATGDDAAYVVYKTGATASFDAVSNVKATYFSLQTNKAGPNGVQLSDTATETAETFGDVVTGDVAFVGSDRTDRMFGRNADDWFEGAGGRDVIRSGAGDDTVIGGAGDDRIMTGAGEDVIVFAAGDGHDRVLDFKAEDTLDLQGLDLAGGDISDYAEAGADANDTLLTFDADHSILLKGVDVDEVTDLNVLF